MLIIIHLRNEMELNLLKFATSSAQIQDNRFHIVVHKCYGDKNREVYKDPLGLGDKYRRVRCICIDLQFQSL